jgi:hypothetical protein
MLRSLGIPAYLEIGIVFNSGISGDDTVWAGHLKIKERPRLTAGHGYTLPGVDTSRPHIVNDSDPSK